MEKNKVGKGIGGAGGEVGGSWLAILSRAVRDDLTKKYDSEQRLNGVR